MDPATVVITAMLLLGGFFSVATMRHFSDQRNSAMEAWREAVRAAGFKDLRETNQSRPGDFVTSPRLVVTGGGFTISFDLVKLVQDKYATRVCIEGVPPALSLSLETRATLQARGKGFRDLEVGDPVFDDEVFVQGPAALVQAIMDYAMRLRVRSMLGSGIEVRGGALHALVPNDYGLSSEYGLASRAPMKALLPLLIEFARRLQRPADFVDRLVAGAKADPVAGVRRANLLMLARQYPEHASTRPALSEALSDPDDAVRLCAATMLAPEGTPVLLEIAGGEDTDDACAGQAVTALGARLPPVRALAILIHALRARRLLTASACVASLGRAQSPDAIPTLAKVLTREQGSLAEDAARSLAGFDRPEAEAALVGGLQHAAPTARAAAAEALGTCGSVAAVEPLRLAEAQHSGDAAFRRAARQAIAAIQARAGSASPGQLTFAEGESGRLSLGGDEAGHVSLAPANKDDRRGSGGG